MNCLVWGDHRHFSPGFQGGYKTLVRTEKRSRKVGHPPAPHSGHSANVSAPPVPTWNRHQITVLADAALTGKLISSLSGRGGGEESGGRWEKKRSPASESEVASMGCSCPRLVSQECVWGGRVQLEKTFSPAALSTWTLVTSAQGNTLCSLHLARTESAVLPDL